MRRKTAILQCADQGPAESFAAMLRTVGYNVYLPNKSLRDELRRIGCDTVLSPRDLTASMGYDPVALPEMGPDGMQKCDVYADVKAHRSCAKLVARWPNLQSRVLWYRINGGKPEHVINARGDHGDEVNPPCPVLTPNQWYAFEGESRWSWDHLAYTCWPPFVRFNEYNYPREGRHARGMKHMVFEPPICLIHGINGWGYGALIDSVRNLGVRCYGASSPDGLIQHREIPLRLSKALCMVHLKSSDAPGYSLYEALAAACPVICTRRLIWRCKMQSLFIPGETCLVFDRETHDGLTPEDVAECTRELTEHLARLQDPAENKRIGQAGRERLKAVMWSESKKEDVESLREFMGRHFG